MAYTLKRLDFNIDEMANCLRVESASHEDQDLIKGLGLAGTENLFVTDDREKGNAAAKEFLKQFLAPGSEG